MYKKILPLGAGALVAAAGFTVYAEGPERHEKVVIVGAGAGGIGVMGFLSRAGVKDITIIEPKEVHYYQPYWTLVGGGQKKNEQSASPMKNLIPQSVTWLKEGAAQFIPEENSVILGSGKRIHYDYLVVATGLQINWKGIPGLAESVGKPDTGVVSIYDYDYSAATWDAISKFKGTRAFFTLPNSPVKCAGAPQKIMWLFEDFLRKNNKREGVDIRYWVPGAAIFGVKRYADLLEVMRQDRGVKLEPKKELVKVDGATKTATFKSLEDGTVQEEKFDLLHVCPPMGPPDVIRDSPLADAAGWVDVDKHTLQHKKYPNIFACGDCTNTPNGKTAAAITAQAPVLVHNIQRAMDKKPLNGVYNGYSSCPVIFKYGKVMLAEFGYDGKILETFGAETGQWPLSMMGQHGSLQYSLFWWFKTTAFPMAYWYLWPRGVWYGTNGPFKPDVTRGAQTQLKTAN